jgi:saccharopine dehydrogenase-like NADP-dependent oxidoreductase
MEVDLSNPAAVARIIRDHDLAVGALPSRLGYQAARAAVEARRNYVDIAFYAEDLAEIHQEAMRAGVAILPDCGLAPGISNLLVGRALSQGMPDEIHIQVGGVAQDPKQPYGYVVTWSLDDLVEEYTRPARILRNGAVTILPVFSELRRTQVRGVGELESFLTDGLRTLLDCGVREMTEKTLRWPGHVEQIQPLLASGKLVEEFRQRCTGADDLVVLLFDVVRGRKRESIRMVDRAQGGLTAMARTTALTCAAFARWAATGTMAEKGVVPPEKIGTNEQAYRFILQALEKNGISLHTD